MRRVVLVCGVLFSLSFLRAAAPPQEDAPWRPAAIEGTLESAGPNRAELIKALDSTPREQRKGMAFLLTHMPAHDARSLQADILLENVALAYKARKEVPWGERIPEDIFLNDILPYANVDEARHPWRKQLHDLCLPLVKDCKSPSEAAQKLNTSLFSALEVRYSTARKKPHQSPKETIEQGLATCTGLSILLSDACRSVAVPARLAGTPLWVNKRGNHTWVEVWDGGWHFTGAAEPDPKGLDRAWFTSDAAQAKKDDPDHAIYATSFRRTGLLFPLVWAPGQKDVCAENVTDRYARSKAEKPGLTKEQAVRVEKEALAFFSAGEDQRAKWRAPSDLDALLAGNEEGVRQTVWKAYQDAPIHAARKKDFERNQVRYQTHLSPYTVKKVGARPRDGWPLFIALHGGGGTAREVNDSQWRVMQRYYRDQPSVPGYQYLALRAPNDRWNGFYDTYVPPLVVNLIRQFLLFGDVNPDKVFLLGYSHGGYGAFYVGPKVPDRFAAVHSSAAAPTDGAISPLTLRNTRFTFMIGEKDTAYGRRTRCEAFAREIEKLKEADKGAYPVALELKKGLGHTGLPDRDKIKEMYPFTRNAVPRRLRWALTDSVLGDFFWLSVKPAAGQAIDATIEDNAVEVRTKGVTELDLHLDSRLVDFSKPLRVTLDGKAKVLVVKPSLGALCRSLLERGDLGLACTCRVRLQAEKP